MSTTPEYSLNNASPFSRKDSEDTVFGRLHKPRKAAAIFVPDNPKSLLLEQYIGSTHDQCFRSLVVSSCTDKYIIQNNRPQIPNIPTHAPMGASQNERCESMILKSISTPVKQKSQLLDKIACPLDTSSSTTSLLLDLQADTVQPQAPASSNTSLSPLQSSTVSSNTIPLLFSPDPRIASENQRPLPNIPPEHDQTSSCASIASPSLKRKKPMSSNALTSSPNSAAAARNILQTPHRHFKDLTFNTPGGTEMTTARSVGLEITHGADIKKGRLHFFSPNRSDHLLHSKIHTRKEQKKPAPVALSPACDTPPPSDTKDGKVTLRLHKRNRKDKKLYPDQIQIAGKSASSALETALEMLMRRYQENENMQTMIKSLAKNFKFEWLHRIAFSLAPENFNPQTMENLGCGGSWINSSMMILEKVAQHFAHKYPDCVEINPSFKMEPGTHVIRELEYEVTIQKDILDKNNSGMQTHSKVKAVIRSKMDVLTPPNRENWASLTDAALLRETTQALLNLKSPVHRTQITH